MPRLYATLAQVAALDNRVQLGFLGSRKRIRERTEQTQSLINGALQVPYQEALNASKLKGLTPEFKFSDGGIEA